MKPGVNEHTEEKKTLDDDDSLTSTLNRNKKSVIELYVDGCQSLFTPISPHYNTILFDQDISSSSHSSKSNKNGIPEAGSVVALVGRAAYPCVCEIAKESSGLFSDKSSSVVAEGVRWQSLYMVFLGKHMILAEPAKGGSSGDGRVVTAVSLSGLQVEMDNSVEIQNASPARRLLLTCRSPEINAPGLFCLNPSQIDYSRGQNYVKIAESSLDLWFEDASAANQAYKALYTKIAKARSKRGKKIRDSLSLDQRFRFSTLLSNVSS